jgi:hypothetical protein
MLINKMDHNEGVAEDFEDVKYENLNLQQKLEMMQKIQNKMINDSKKKPVKMFAPKSFRKETKTGNEPKVSSQMNFDLIMEQKKYKEEITKQKKSHMELKDCTFKPKINKVNASLVQSQQHIPIFDRPMPERKITQPKPDDIEEQELIGDKDENKIKKKADPEFYKRQLEWKQQREEKQMNERLAKQLTEYESTKAIPKVNTKKNDKLLADQPAFMDRTKQQIEKSKALKEQLDQKYNSLTFKPKINKNVSAKSNIFPTPEQE